MSVLEKRGYKPADERREQILDCALQVFAERGYHGSSIADVCARAGIGRATLYQYFDDKRDVLVELGGRIERRVSEAIATRPDLRLPKGSSPTETELVAFVAARFSHVLRAVFDEPATARLVLRAGRGADGVVDDLLRRIDAMLLEVMEHDLRAAIRIGLVRPVDVVFVTRFFLGGIEKVVLTLLDEDRPVDVEAIAREAALLELVGTLAPAARPTFTVDGAKAHSPTIRLPAPKKGKQSR